MLDKIDKIIEKNIDNTDFQLSDITNSLAISRVTLYRFLLKLTGLSPNQYIRKKRLEKAKELLEVGVYSTVKETALAVGFRNFSYFSKQFYKEFQVLPKDLLQKE